MTAAKRKQGGQRATYGPLRPPRSKTTKPTNRFPLRTGLALSAAIFVAAAVFWRIYPTAGPQTHSKKYIHPFPLGEFHPALSIASLPQRGAGGRGVVYIPQDGQANEPIPAGTPLIHEEALYVLPHVEPNPRAWVRRELNAWAPEKRDLYFDLANAKHGAYGVIPEDARDGNDAVEWDDEHVQGIFETNAVSAGATGGGVFANTSIINHSCAPNAIFRFRADLDPPVMSVLALRDIEPGEEVRTAYIDGRLGRADRRRLMKGHYGFDCDCAVCSLEGPELERSDGRRKRLAQVRKDIEAFSRGAISAEDVLALVQESVALSEAEGALGESAPSYADATTVSAHHSDEHATKYWAERAAAAYAVEMGADHPTTVRMEQVAREPRLHGAWGQGRVRSVSWDGSD